jgi:hypothetical protein
MMPGLAPHRLEPSICRDEAAPRWSRTSSATTEPTDGGPAPKSELLESPLHPTSSTSKRNTCSNARGIISGSPTSIVERHASRHNYRARNTIIDEGPLSSLQATNR